jgi:hypothetical protein
MTHLIESYVPVASAERTAPPILEAANPADAPTTNPIGSAPVAPAVASTNNFQLASVKPDQKLKMEASKLHLHGATLVHGPHQPGKPVQSVARNPVQQLPASATATVPAAPRRAVVRAP